MSKLKKEAFERISLCIQETIELNPVNDDGASRTFRILEELGSGGTAIAYKVEYDGADNNRYLYVLKEVYPCPTSNNPAIARRVNTLQIDEYDAAVSPENCYAVYRKRFEEAYRVQNEMATGENAVASMTTSLPIGLYEDRASSRKGDYALYGLFQYSVGHTLKTHKEESLLELIDIQRQIAEVVKTYHDQGYLWLDIKEANVNVVGAGSVQSVSMFDFGSLISRDKLIQYKAGTDPDFVLSFSPTSSDLLLPQEMQSLLELSRESEFGFVDVHAAGRKVNLLGNYGVQADIFLLGSMLFKRLMGKVPTVQDCEQLQDGTFDMTRFEMLRGYSEGVSAKIKAILANCLFYEKRENRYLSVSAYMIDLKELYLDLCTHEGLSIIQGNARRYVTLCCNRYLNTILTGDADGKFKHLKQLQGRFESRVTLRSDRSNKDVLPSAAINNASPTEGGENRLVFLYGDGGMGKSTALYDYMREAASVTTIYIELSQYRSNRDKTFIFERIFETICHKFVDAVGFIKEEALSRVEDILLKSLSELDANDPRPQYVLLLDGYNEISKEDRGGFDGEMRAIIDAWKNCRIVITGRNIPADDKGEKIPLYDRFSCFEYVGISEQERSALIAAKYPESVERIRRDERLWDVLRIPMFMGMFIQFELDQAVSVHTRGEILEQFVMKKEMDAAAQIADRQTGNAQNASLRLFLVQYGLPIIASEMDQQRSFSVKVLRIAIGMNRAWKVYDKEAGLMVGLVLGIDVPDKPSNANAKTIHILNVEAGYCYKTLDGEYGFIHQYFRDYFAAKHIQNILNAAKALGQNGLSRAEQLQFTKDNGLEYTWSDDVCILLGEIIGDYKNEPGYTEE